MKFTALFTARRMVAIPLVITIAVFIGWFVKVQFLTDAKAKPRGKVIYGEDNRLEYFQVTDPAVRALADSTAALINQNSLVAKEGRFEVKGQNFRKTYMLCADERFGEQNISAFCSGFLVGPQLVATAGHCVETPEGCAKVKFVFGFNLKQAGVVPTEVDAQDVYSCGGIVDRKEELAGADYALIQLDRPVVNRQPLRLRSAGTVQPGEDLTVIGHPTGLPQKIAAGARVRTSDLPTHFVANLDTYGGNSGSPVFNTKTLEVEGILVRGETDFLYKDGCTVSKVCQPNECRGEDVTKISALFPSLPAPPSPQ